VLQLDRLLRLRVQLIRLRGRFLGLTVDEFLRRLPRLFDEAAGVGRGLLEEGGALLLRGLELRLHLLRVFQAGLDLVLALVEGRKDGLEGEFPEREGDDREAEDLRRNQRHADAEIMEDFRDAVVMGGRRGGMAGSLGEYEQGGKHDGG
jgi:hypothetical protein